MNQNQLNDTTKPPLSRLQHAAMLRDHEEGEAKETVAFDDGGIVPRYDDGDDAYNGFDCWGSSD